MEVHVHLTEDDLDRIYAITALHGGRRASPTAFRRVCEEELTRRYSNRWTIRASREPISSVVDQHQSRIAYINLLHFAAREQHRRARREADILYSWIDEVLYRNVPSQIIATMSTGGNGNRLGTGPGTGPINPTGVYPPPARTTATTTSSTQATTTTAQSPRQTTTQPTPTSTTTQYTTTIRSAPQFTTPPSQRTGQQRQHPVSPTRQSQYKGSPLHQSVTRPQQQPKRKKKGSHTVKPADVLARERSRETQEVEQGEGSQESEESGGSKEEERGEESQTSGWGETTRDTSYGDELEEYEQTLADTQKHREQFRATAQEIHEQQTGFFTRAMQQGGDSSFETVATEMRSMGFGTGETQAQEIGTPRFQEQTPPVTPAKTQGAHEEQSMEEETLHEKTAEQHEFSGEFLSHRERIGIEADLTEKDFSKIEHFILDHHYDHMLKEVEGKVAHRLEEKDRQLDETLAKYRTVIDKQSKMLLQTNKELEDWKGKNMENFRAQLKTVEEMRTKYEEHLKQMRSRYDDERSKREGYQTQLKSYEELMDEDQAKHQDAINVLHRKIDILENEIHRLKSPTIEPRQQPPSVPSVPTIPPSQPHVSWAEPHVTVPPAGQVDYDAELREYQARLQRIRDSTTEGWISPQQPPPRQPAPQPRYTTPFVPTSTTTTSTPPAGQVPTGTQYQYQHPQYQQPQTTQLPPAPPPQPQYQTPQTPQITYPQTPTQPPTQQPPLQTPVQQSAYAPPTGYPPQTGYQQPPWQMYGQYGPMPTMQVAMQDKPEKFEGNNVSEWLRDFMDYVQSIYQRDSYLDLQYATMIRQYLSKNVIALIENKPDYEIVKSSANYWQWLVATLKEAYKIKDSTGSIEEFKEGFQRSAFADLISFRDAFLRRWSKVDKSERTNKQKVRSFLQLINQDERKAILDQKDVMKGADLTSDWEVIDNAITTALGISRTEKSLGMPSRYLQTIPPTLQQQYNTGYQPQQPAQLTQPLQQLLQAATPSAQQTAMVPYQSPQETQHPVGYTARGQRCSFCAAVTAHQTSDCPYLKDYKERGLIVYDAENKPTDPRTGKWITSRTRGGMKEVLDSPPGADIPKVIKSTFGQQRQPTASSFRVKHDSTRTVWEIDDSEDEWDYQHEQWEQGAARMRGEYSPYANSYQLPTSKKSYSFRIGDEDPRFRIEEEENELKANMFKATYQFNDDTITATPKVSSTKAVSISSQKPMTHEEKLAFNARELQFYNETINGLLSKNPNMTQSEAHGRYLADADKRQREQEDEEEEENEERRRGPSTRTRSKKGKDTAPPRKKGRKQAPQPSPEEQPRGPDTEDEETDQEEEQEQPMDEDEDQPEQEPTPKKTETGKTKHPRATKGKLMTEKELKWNIYRDYLKDFTALIKADRAIAEAADLVYQ